MRLARHSSLGTAQNGRRPGGIGAVVAGTLVAVAVGALFLALIGADRADRLAAPALRTQNAVKHQRTTRTSNRLERKDMQSRSLGPLSTRHRRRLRGLRSKWMLALAIGAAGSAAYAGNVLATPSQGLSTTILAQSQFNSFFAQGHAFPPAWGALMAAYGQTDAYVVDNKIDPGGTTGWHKHPGPSLILVVSGQVTNYTSQDPNCAGHIYTAGQGFIDGAGNDEHTLRNNGTTEAETIAVQLIPHGAPRKIDESNPTRCPV